MTKAEVQTLINTNLASDTIITAVKHREVENALLNYMDDVVSLKPLKVGLFGIGNPPSGTSTYNVTFSPPLSTPDYGVVSSLGSASGTPANDTQISYAVGDKTANGFKIYVTKLANVTQNIYIDYVLFAF
jgi:hypothetical protein